MGPCRAFLGGPGTARAGGGAGGRVGRTGRAGGGVFGWQPLFWGRAACLDFRPFPAKPRVPRPVGWTVSAVGACPKEKEKEKEKARAREKKKEQENEQEKERAREKEKEKDKDSSRLS